MPTAAIAGRFDPVDDGGGELDAGGPLGSVGELDLHGSPERLDHGIVVPVADGSDLLDESRGADPLGERPRRVLAGFKGWLQHRFAGGSVGVRRGLRRVCVSRGPCGAGC